MSNVIFGGFQKNLYGADRIDSVYEGKIAEHIVGQELLAAKTSPLFKLHFWNREKNNPMLKLIFSFTMKVSSYPLK